MHSASPCSFYFLWLRMVEFCRKKDVYLSPFRNIISWVGILKIWRYFSLVYQVPSFHSPTYFWSRGFWVTTTPNNSTNMIINYYNNLSHQSSNSKTSNSSELLSMSYSISWPASFMISSSWVASWGLFSISAWLNCWMNPWAFTTSALVIFWA